MTEQTPADATTEFAKELARQLPLKAVYDDLASPATKQTGQLLQDVVKAIQLALAPVQVLGALQDRYRNFLDKSVRRVPEESRISPAPQIIGPVLEGVRYEQEGTPIEEMFSQLLSRAMDKERVAEAHPAYPILIKQLSADEAKILASLNGQQFDYVYTRDYNPTTNLFYGPNKVEVDTLPRDGLSFPGNVAFYFEHLDKLGLAGTFIEGNQEPLFAHLQKPSPQTGMRVRCKYRLTDFGARFVRACLGDN
jgi:hypothetical protein